MKKVFAILAILAAIPSFAQSVSNDRVYNSIPDIKTLSVTRKSLGLGSPAPMITIGTENALEVDDNYYHVPQDMPFYPTAGVLWPRVVELECESIKGKIICEGYHWAPAMGRAEYLFVVPKIKKSVPPAVIYREVPVRKKLE